jgi:CheY-like chemotaxis protein
MTEITGAEAATADPSSLLGLHGSPSARLEDEHRRVALIVEGEAPIGLALADLLAGLGWRSLVAHGPEHATMIAQEQALDMLVADFDLGGTSGASLAASVTRRQAAVPVVLISGLHDAAHVEVWPPQAFMPTILGIGALGSTIAAMFDMQHAPQPFPAAPGPRPDRYL